MEYYILLRSILKTRPELRGRLTRCCHCRIFFLTEPPNRGRRDLGCPFGCRESHRKRESTRRSVEYYRGKNGKILKGFQNAKRRLVAPTFGVEVVATAVLAESGFCVPVVEYVRGVVGMVEGRRVSLREVVEMLSKVLRQHSIGWRRKIDYIVDQLHENQQKPP